MTNLLPPETLEQIQRLAEAATSTPWRERSEDEHVANGVIYGPDDSDGDYTIIGSLKGRKNFGSFHWSQYSIPTGAQGDANAAFIVALVNAWPALRDEVTRLRGENERLQTQHIENGKKNAVRLANARKVLAANLIEATGEDRTASQLTGES